VFSASFPDIITSGSAIPVLQNFYNNAIFLLLYIFGRTEHYAAHARQSSVSLYLLAETAKTVGPIDMPIRLLTPVDQKNHVH